jgi:hypothetical protein
MPELSEGFDRMLRIVVVLRDSVIAEKRKQLVSVPFQTLLDLRRSLTPQGALGDLPKESLHGWRCFFKKRPFKPYRSILSTMGVSKTVKASVSCFKKICRDALDGSSPDRRGCRCRVAARLQRYLVVERSEEQ